MHAQSMLNLMTLWHKPVGLVILTLMLSACASAPSRPPAEVSSVEIDQNESQDIEQEPQDLSSPVGVQPGLQIEELERARYYESQAQNSSQQNTRIDAILSAAEYYIQAQDFTQAANQLESLGSVPLSTEQNDRQTVIKAYIAYDQNDLVTTLKLLRPLWQRKPIPLVDEDAQVESQPSLPQFAALTTQQIDALLLGSLSYQRAGDFDSAIAALIQRERGLIGAARAETTRYIWQVINRISLAERQAIIDSTVDPLVRNRIEQSMGSQTGQAILEPEQFTQWRDAPGAVATETIANNWTANSPRSIAILLPLNSRFQKAAQALREGIEYQHQQNESAFRPQIQFYDVGDSPFNIAQYYNAAVQNGAEFVIGPLGREFADQLGTFSDLGRVPTVLLGGYQALGSGTSRFVISPEQEGRQIAEQAWRDGHLSTAIMRTTGRTSERTASAFKDRWLELGGKIANEMMYSSQQFDHSVELKQLFAINQSRYRHSRLSAVLDFKPKFSAYQRADIDFIFMYAAPAAARLLRPQINFFSGSKVPVYSAANIYDGIPDKVNNTDLNQTHFPVMPWVLGSARVARYAGQLNRLFALGSDAYDLAAQYQILKNNDSLSFNGRTGRVSIAADGMVMSQPLWAQFKDGEAVVDDSLGIDINPLGVPNTLDFNQPSDRFSNQKGRNSENSYNEQTWDAQKSTRR